MKFFARGALFLLLLALVNGVIFVVLSRNAEAGIYPADADSIGIPLIESVGFSIVSACLLLLCVAASAFSSWRPVSARRAVLWAQLSTVTLSSLTAAIFFGLWGWSWASTHHWPIVIVCGGFGLFVLHLGVQDIRRLRPNNSSKPTPLRGAA